MTLHQILNFLSGVVVVALLASVMARADDRAIRVTSEQGSPVARLQVGDSRCVLKDDQVRCAPISK